MDLHGWDVVVLCHQNGCNRILAEGLKSHSATVRYQDREVTIDATLSGWAIIPGGANKLLRMQLTFGGGTVTGLSTQPASLVGVQATIEVQMAFVNNAQVANQVDLQFNLSVVGQQPGDETDGAVTMVNATDSQGAMQQSVGADYKSVLEALGSYVPKCLIAHQDQFAYVMSCLNVGSGNSPWLAMKHFQYGYLPSGYLAIAGVVTDRDTSTLQLLVDDEITNGGTEVMLAISKPLAMQYILMPCVQQAYGRGTTAASFQFLDPTAQRAKVAAMEAAYKEKLLSILGNLYSENSIDNLMTNVDQQLEAQYIINDDIIAAADELPADGFSYSLTSYQPVVTGFSVQLTGDKLTSRAMGNCPITGLSGANINFSVSCISQFSYNVQTRQASFTPVGDVQVNVVKDVSNWYYALIAAGGSGAVALGIIEGVTDTITLRLQQSLLSQAASFDLTAMTGDRVRWPGFPGTVIESVMLAEVMLLRMTLSSTESTSSPAPGIARGIDSGDAAWFAKHHGSPPPFITPGGGME